VGVGEAFIIRRDFCLNVLVGIPSRIQVFYGGENLLGHYPTVTGAPARFILRIGWANGRHRGRGALRLHGRLLNLIFYLESASELKSLDRSRKLQFYFFDLGRPLRDLGPSNNFPEMKRMQGQKPLSLPAAWHEYLSAT
jgi:hypothetical protein